MFHAQITPTKATNSTPYPDEESKTVPDDVDTIQSKTRQFNFDVEQNNYETLTKL